MFQRKVFYICVLLFVVSKVSAQVNLQTGSATFSLPIFNWKDDKSRLYAGVALNYNSGNGLKVNDVASNVGQGWNLVAGGVITRMQVGEPDDQKAFAGTGDNDIRRYPNGIFYANTPAQNGCPDALRKYPIYKQQNQIYKARNEIAEDKQLDYFSFQFNGKVGVFVLDRINNVGVTLGDSKLKITFQHDLTMANMSYEGIRTTIKSFTIQDVDGLTYKFTKYATTKVLELNFCDRSLTKRQTMPKIRSNRIYDKTDFENSTFVNTNIIGSWYLTEIEDPLTKRDDGLALRKVFFNYDVTSNINMFAGEDISYNDEREYGLVSHKKTVCKTPEITSIVYPEGHTVTFVYKSTPRVDLIGAHALSTIDIGYLGRSLSRHILNTSYFISNRYGTPVTEYQKKVARLCLLSVQKIGVDLKEDTPPYKFDYYMGSTSSADDVVPPPFTYAKDIWGFYNGNNTVGFFNEPIDITTPANAGNNNQLKGICHWHNGSNNAYLNPKTDYAKNGLLRQIIYPTGGTLTYNYEQNNGIINGASSSSPVGGVHVFQTVSTDGGYSNGCDNPLTTKYKYVLDDGTSSSLWGIERPVNVLETSSYYRPEYRTYKWPCGFFGCCDYKFKYPGILSQTEAISVTDFQNAMQITSYVLGIIGMASTTLEIVNMIASGSTIVSWAGIIFEIYSGLIISCLQNNSQLGISTVHFNTDLNSISPLPTQFKRVEVVQNPVGVGKTVYEFTSSDDYAIWENNNPGFSAKQRFAPWAYGLPKKITVRDDLNNIIKQTENVYNFNINYSTEGCSSASDSHYVRSSLLKREINISSCKCLVKNTISQRYTHWSDPNYFNASYLTTSDGNMDVNIYKVYTGRVELSKVYERTYSPNSTTQYLETATEYAYNDENYEMSLTKTVKSDGSTSQKNIYYTIDYTTIHGDCYIVNQPGTTNPEINTLVQKNIISLPVETNTMIFTPYTGSPYKYLSDQATIFTTLPNGDIKPSKTIEGRFDQPTYRNSFWQPDNSNFSHFLPQPLYNPANPDYSFYKITQAFTYDDFGNLIGVKDEGNRQITNIYDYQDKYVVASVINADPLIDKAAYSSFEVQDKFGGWTLAGGGSSYDNSSITGKKSFILNGRTFTRSLSTAKPYTLSFWANNGNVIVNGGATLLKSSPTFNGFTYYEYAIAQGTGSVSVSGNAFIDELRVYPQTARMRTVTFDPLIGKTSECDENNRISYYEYDNLGRMRFIKDEKSNIVKMYEYNNVSDAKSNGCPVTYYNRLITEKFLKTNCGAGYLGGFISYSVPAATFSSTISQADADAQAENSLLINGPIAANAASSSTGCTLIYYNEPRSLNVTSEGCGDGYVGGTVTYTVPAGTYSSLVDQADANRIADEDIEANAQAYANDPAHRVCVTDPNPVWEWDNINSYCLSINGNLPPHLFVYEKDVNPNSPTYNQTRWSDVGPDDACPSNTYYNAPLTVLFTKNNCTSGQVGTLVPYVVPAGKYSSTVSQAAADLLANNEANANGQTNANNNGDCVAACRNYIISVPYSVGTNLYIRVKRCTGQTVVLNWNTEIIYDESGDPDRKIASLCLSAESLITFRYGANGSSVSIPEITVTQGAPCE